MQGILDLAPGVTVGTATSASGTTLDFTGIPSTAKSITISFNAVSTNGTSNVMVQIGDSGGIETSGYLGAATISNSGGNSSANFTTGFGVYLPESSATVAHGSIRLTLFESSTNTWVSSASGGYSSTATSFTAGGSKATSAVLDRVRITTVNGTDSLDSGKINIEYQ